MNENLARDLIESQFSKLAPISIKFLGEGWDNKVYLVNENILFRFPKQKSAVQLLENEACLLPQIKNRVSLPIPEIIFQGKPALEFPWPFLGL